MKKILIICTAVCLCQVTTAQNKTKIDVALQQEMSLRKASELIGINIILKQQYDQMDMRKKSNIFSEKETKRTFVVDELKRFSGETQQNVINYLKQFLEKEQVANIQPHWIYNGIYCYATKNIIEILSTFDDILIIGFDKQYRLAPDDKKTDFVSRSGDTTYNVLKINANQVWDLGYTGEGVIVTVADCGINYNHYDLKDHMWEHPNFPYHGWNFVFNNNDPMDIEGHGTHCAGTVAGMVRQVLKQGWLLMLPLWRLKFGMICKD